MSVSKMCVCVYALDTQLVGVKEFLQGSVDVSARVYRDFSIFPATKICLSEDLVWEVQWGSILQTCLPIGGRPDCACIRGMDLMQIWGAQHWGWKTPCFACLVFPLGLELGAHGP